MKTENILILAVVLLSFFLGGLSSYVFLRPKTISVSNTHFQSPPDSVVIKKPTVPNSRIVGKPDFVHVVKDSLHSTLNPLAPAAPPIESGKDNLKQEMNSYRRFEDSLGVYNIRALADCAVKEFELQINHKPMQFVSDCNPLTNFGFGILSGIVLSLITAIIFIL